MKEKKCMKNALLATTAASLLVTGTGLLNVNATGGDEFLTPDSLVGVNGTIATDVDTNMTIHQKRGGKRRLKKNQLLKSVERKKSKMK